MRASSHGLREGPRDGPRSGSGSSAACPEAVRPLPTTTAQLAMTSSTSAPGKTARESSLGSKGRPGEQSPVSSYRIPCGPPRRTVHLRASRLQPAHQRSLRARPSPTTLSVEVAPRQCPPCTRQCVGRRWFRGRSERGAGHPGGYSSRRSSSPQIHVRGTGSLRFIRSGLDGSRVERLNWAIVVGVAVEAGGGRDQGVQVPNGGWVDRDDLRQQELPDSAGARGRGQ